MEKRDEEIMMDYQAGRKEAVRMIFQRYKSRILSFCLRTLGHRADAEEAASEVFLALFTSRYQFDPKTKFSTWLYRIARNQCVNQFRRRKNMTSLEFSSSNGENDSSWDIPDQNDLPREEMDRKETSVHVRSAIEKLPYEQREAIVLQHYDGLSYEEISEVMECSLDKVKILIFRAKERLRIELTSLLKENEYE